MSKIPYIAAKIFPIILLFTFPVFAEKATKPQEVIAQNLNKEQLKEEIVYRAALGRPDDVSILLKQGASANEVSELGVPIVSLAASRQDPEMIKVLQVIVEAGADVNKPDANGQTPIFYAAKIGNKEALQYLLSKGVAYGTSDSSGNTARSVAYDAGYNEIVEILDNFVHTKNEEVKKQYAEEINRQYKITYLQLEENYKRYKKLDADRSAEVEYAKNSAINAIRKAVYNMSFSACSAAYWQYFASSRRPTELKGYGLRDSIYSARGKRDEIASKLVENSKFDRNLVYKIINISEVQIVYKLAISNFNDLNKQQAMGTNADMKETCGNIAKSWLEENSPTPTQPDSAQTR